MRSCLSYALLPAVLILSGCGADPGPVETSTETLDGGVEAEYARVDLNIGAGELDVRGGAVKLLDATFRYSKNFGKPIIDFSRAGVPTRLTIESPKKVFSGPVTNDWKLTFGGLAPLELHVRIGAGKGTINATQMALKSLNVEMGAGELSVDLRKQYTKDIDVNIKGGVGQAKIYLPKDTGVEADVQGGIGAIDTPNLTKKDGRYYNAAYASGKPAVRLMVRGGVGQIQLISE